MRKYQYPRKALRDNRGISLIELIISIMVLVIIMLPLMNSFYRSAFLNKKAKATQEQSNLAANLMEGLKNYNIRDTITEFTKAAESFGIIDINEDADVKLLVKTETGYLELDMADRTTEEQEALQEALSKQTTLYFAIYGIRTGSSAYDALITMSALPYKQGESILNNYPMPDAINLDIMVNGLIFSDGRAVEDGNSEGASFDNEALEEFLQLGSDYAKTQYYQSATYRNAYDRYINESETSLTPVPTPPELNFNPSSYPEYCNADVVKSQITKTMKITVNQSGEGVGNSNIIQYDIKYNCAWPTGSTLNNTLQYSISSVRYAEPVENIYLFYKPSIFTTLPMMTASEDYIEIDNRTPDYALNFFLAKQYETGSTLFSRVTMVTRSADRVKVYTNIGTLNRRLVQDGTDHSDLINQNIVNTSEKDRIYNTEIKLYQHVDTENIEERFLKQIYTLSSATENID